MFQLSVLGKYTEIIPATKIVEIPEYKEIVSPYSKDALHYFGGLYRLMKSPELYNQSLLAVTRIDNLPVSIVSITSNPEGSFLVAENRYLVSPINIHFPNYEIMAFTHPDYRGKGLATKGLSELLKSMNLSKTNLIYVYSQKMERILKRIGYPRCENLHEYTP